MEKRSEKKYRVIAKVGAPNSGLGNKGFVKYNVNNLYKFAQFLDQKFPGWLYFNVYAYVKGSPGPQLGSYTKNARPTTKWIATDKVVS